MVRLTQKKLDRLQAAIRTSAKVMEPFRRNRVAMIRQYVGSNYSDSGASKKVAVPMLELAVRVFGRYLMARYPHSLVTTPHLQLKPLAKKYELVINQEMERLDLETEMQEAVIDALFCVGVMHTGLEYGRDGVDLVTRRISLDRLVIDAKAKRFKDVTFVGRRYHAVLDDVLANPEFDKKAKKDLTPQDRREREDSSIDAAEEITDDTKRAGDSFEDFVELCEVYLPRYDKVVTMPYLNNGAPPLAIRDYYGPRAGMGGYRILSLGLVPDNLMPRSPVASLYELHMLLNELFRKIGRQATRQKTVLGCDPAAKEAAEQVKNAQDGEILVGKHLDAIKEFATGGAAQTTFGAFLQAKDLFMMAGGNLDLLGGFSPQSPTATQDAMLNQNASLTVREMVDKAIGFARGVVRDIAWFVWDDPATTYEVTRQMGSITLPMKFTPEQRLGPLERFKIDIDPYSMRRRTPEERFATLMQMVKEVVLPAAQQLAAQGIWLDFTELFDQAARLTGVEEIRDILVFANRAEPAAEGGSAGPRDTTRTYERINRPGATRSGKDGTLAQIMAGGGVQESELAALTRPIG